MFDSHCHLTDSRFAEDIDAVIGRAWDAGLAGIVTVASDVDDARAAHDIVRRHPGIRRTAGIHPHRAEVATPEDLEAVRELANLPDVVAIGETGLDFHYDHSPRDVQRKVFLQQIEVAADTGLPVVVHCRSADDDVVDIIRDANVRGVLHCFSGGRRLFEAAIEADWYISFAGMVTFRNFQNESLLRATPLDRLLVETDSPYLAPVPHRGHRNEPAYVVHTCHAAALIRNEDPAAVAAATTANAFRFYGIPESTGSGPVAA